MILESIVIAVVGLMVGAASTLQTLADIKILGGALSLAAAVGAFNTYNNIIDIELDAINKPHRPLPSKRLEFLNANVFFLLLAGVSLLTAYALSFPFFLIISSILILALFYSIPNIHLKSKFIINSLIIASIYGLLSPLAGWALYPHKSLPLIVISFLFIIAIGLAILKDFEDVIGDRMHNVDTAPIILGKDITSKYMMGSIIFGSILLAISIYQNILPWPYVFVFPFLILIALAVNSLRKSHSLFGIRNIYNRTIALIILMEITMIYVVIF